MSLGDWIKRAGEEYNVGAPANRSYERQGVEATNLAKRAQDIRGRSAGFIGGISRDQRNFYDNSVVPVENQTADDVQAGLNPDYATIRSNASKDVAKSFAKAKDNMLRRAARYGQQLSPSEERIIQHNQDKAEVDTRNRAADAARDDGVARANQFYAGGMHLPGVAAGGSAAGATGIGDYYDYQSLSLANHVNDRMADRMSVANSFSEGGEVGLGMGGSHDYADGGDVDLESGDYIIKASVVKALGPEFFDKLCDEADGEMSTEDSRASGDDAYADGGVVGGFMRGLRAGFDDRRADESHEARMAREKEDATYRAEDRSFQSGQRERLLRQQKIEDAANEFSNELQTAAGRTIATGGADWRAPIDVYNNKFPSVEKLDAVKNADGTFDTFMVTADGARKELGKKIGLEEYVKGLHALSNPKLYFQKMFSDTEKGTYNTHIDDGVAYVTNTKTGKVTIDPTHKKPPKAAVERADANEKEARLQANQAWGTLGANGMINFEGDAADRAAENAQLTMNIFREQGGTDMNAAHQKALGIVRAKKARTEKSGPMAGADPGMFSRGSFDAAAAAAELSALFPQGVDEAEARQIMAKRGIKEPTQQDQVIAKATGKAPAVAAQPGLGMPQRQSTPTPGVAPAQASAPKATYTNPKGKTVTAAQLQQMAAARKMTTQDVINQLQLK